MPELRRMPPLPSLRTNRLPGSAGSCDLFLSTVPANSCKAIGLARHALRVQVDQEECTDNPHRSPEVGSARTSREKHAPHQEDGKLQDGGNNRSGDEL